MGSGGVTVKERSIRVTPLMNPSTHPNQRRHKTSCFFQAKNSFLIGVASTITASIAGTAISNQGANAATAYLFSTPSNYTSFERSLEGTWAGSNGTGAIPTAVWGQFTINDNNSATSEVGTNGGTSTGTASIYFIGDPYGTKKNSGSVSTGCSNNNADGCVYNSSSFTSLTDPGYYNAWYYDSGSNYLYFYNTSGVSGATGNSTGNTDSLRLTLNTTNNTGLYNFDGWNSVSAISWCSNNTQSSTSSGCSDARAWTFSSANALAYIRVPSPSLALGLLPFLALIARRRNGLRFSFSTKQATITSKLHAQSF